MGYWKCWRQNKLFNLRKHVNDSVKAIQFCLENKEFFYENLTKQTSLYAKFYDCKKS